MSLMDADSWISRSYYGGDLSPDAERALHEAALSWDDEDSLDAHLAAAMAAAPGHMAVHLAHYKAYFYRQRWHDAAPHALAILAQVGQRMRVSQDWRRVRPADAPFESFDSDARLYVFSLAAYGFVLVRAGDTGEGRTALRQAALLDIKNQTGAQAILDILDRGPEDDDDDDDAGNGTGSSASSCHRDFDAR